MIGVPFPGRHTFYDGHPYSNGWWLCDELAEWLWNNVGVGSSCGGYKDDADWVWAYIWDEKPTQNAIMFKDEKTALLFKLTWGGV